MTSLDSIRKKYPSLFFAFSFLVLFCFFYYFNKLYIGITSPGNLYFSWLDQHLNYVRGLRHFLLSTTALILKSLGYEAIITDSLMRVKGHGGIILVYSCLGFGVMSFFLAFVIAWPKPVKNKLWFIPLGLISIQLLNITRFILISLYYKSSYDFIDHHSLFNIILYLLLLFILYVWVNKLKPLNGKS